MASLSSLPLTVTVLAALWVSVCRCGVSESWGPGCDNGKLSLDMDLLTDLYVNCSVSAWQQRSPQMHPSIDTTYGPEPARQICMKTPISYNHTIPSSGAYRPVRAASGEYWFCPPQRWLNNLHHGAIVLLYHPCVSLHERHLLSVLARSCLSDYIITPHPRLKRHMPLALVSWGRTLELSAVASADVCDWLETTTTSTRSKLSGVKHIREYNLLLTWPANQHRLLRTHHPDEQQHSTEVKEPLRRCCEQTMSSLLHEAMEAKLESSVKKESSTVKEGRSRHIRAAITEVQINVEKKGDGQKRKSTFLANQTNRDTIRNAGAVQNYNNTLRQSEDSPLDDRKLSDPSAPKEVQRQSQSLTVTTPVMSNMSTIRSDSLAFEAPENRIQQNTEQQNGLDVKSEGNDTLRLPEALVYSFKDEGTDSKEKNYDKHSAASGKMKDNEVVDVKERELDPKQTHSTTDAQHKGESSGFDSLPKSHSASPPQPQQPDAQAAVVKQGLPRTPRTDEAVWAAAALGFLLVLLTLSVLHTRLYRHWRTMPSLYWHDPQQDYDSVADVIQRRQQIAKRRRKRSRRKECVLLPSSSSSDEHP